MIQASTLGELVYDRDGLRVYFNRASEWPYTPVMSGRSQWNKLTANKTKEGAIAWASGYAAGVSDGLNREFAFGRESAKVNIL